MGLLVVLFLASACGGGGAGNGGAFLVWVADGESMTNMTTEARGILATMNDKGETGELFAIPTSTSRVMACSDQATSPNRRFFTFYVGNNTGKLYVMDGGNAPKELDTTSPLTCLGMGTLQYSPDSNRLGYIVFAGDAIDKKLPTGTFIQREASSGAEQISYANTAAFDITNSASAFISLFENSSRQFKEAAIFHRTGDAPQEITTLFADENCQFRNAKVTFVGDNRLAVLLGQECVRNSTWKFYLVDIANKNANLVLSGEVGGQFFSDAAQGILIASPDGANIFFTVQDGVEINTTRLYAVKVADIQDADPRLTSAVMPRQPINRIYDYSVPAAPILSYDGRWLAVVGKTPNNDYSVNILDLTAPDSFPITIGAGNRGDVISAIRFSPDNKRLFYITGGNEGENNSLFYIDIATATETRVIRGRFTGDILLSSDGNSAALMEWELTETPRQPNILHVSLVNISSGQSTRLFSGGTFADGVVTGSRFAYLLWWR
jgi:WD40 repeat protein